MQDLKLFWQWLKTQPNGKEWWENYAPRGILFPFRREAGLPSELVPTYQQWLKGVAPAQRSASLEAEKELKVYEGSVSKHFKRMVQEGDMTYDEYLTKLSEIQTAVDMATQEGRRLAPDFPYYKEAVNLVEDWAFDIQQKQKKEMATWKKKMEGFEEEQAEGKLKGQAEQAKFDLLQQQQKGELGKRETKQRDIDQIKEAVNSWRPGVLLKAKENVATLMQRIFQGQTFQGSEILPVSDEAKGDVARFLQEYPVERVMQILAERILPAEGLPEDQKMNALAQSLEQADFQGKPAQLGQTSPLPRISFGGVGESARQTLGQQLQTEALGKVQQVEQARKEAKAKLQATGASLGVEQRMELQRQARTPETGQEAVVAEAKPLFQAAESLGVGGAGVPFDVEKQTEQAKEFYWQFLQKSYPGKNINLAFRQFPLIFQDYQNEWVKPRTRPGGEGLLAVGQFVPYLEEKGREYLSPYIGERTPIPSPRRRQTELRLR